MDGFEDQNRQFIKNQIIPFAIDYWYSSIFKRDRKSKKIGFLKKLMALLWGVNEGTIMAVSALDL